MTLASKEKALWTSRRLTRARMTLHSPPNSPMGSPAKYDAAQMSLDLKERYGIEVDLTGGKCASEIVTGLTPFRHVWTAPATTRGPLVRNVPRAKACVPGLPVTPVSVFRAPPTDCPHLAPCIRTRISRIPLRSPSR